MWLSTPNVFGVVANGDEPAQESFADADASLDASLDYTPYLDASLDTSLDTSLVDTSLGASSAYFVEQAQGQLGAGGSRSVSHASSHVGLVVGAAAGFSVGILALMCRRWMGTKPGALARTRLSVRQSKSKCAGHVGQK